MTAVVQVWIQDENRVNRFITIILINWEFSFNYM